jgi:[protein-PII] uridylyltransferase
VPIEARQALLERSDVRGARLCRRLSAVTDDWLRGVFESAVGMVDGPLAHGAGGGYGRGELAPFSDLDLVLVHDVKHGVAPMAERLWYPIWDAKVKLGHAVRTVREAARLAADDLATATAMLDARHLAGDRRLTDELRDRTLAAWRKRAKSRLVEMGADVERRHASAGEVAFLLEPNLKDGRGGLRDVHTLRWIEAADFVRLDEAAGLELAYDVLLDARVELHRLAGRPGDVLWLQDQDAVAPPLGYRDADAMMAAVAQAARTIAWTSDEAWRRVASTVHGPRGREYGRDQPMASGVMLRDGEVHIVASADPAADPTLVLRVAAAAARHHTVIERASLVRLARETPPFPAPWPPGAVDDFVSLLLAGRAAIPVFEALDHYDVISRILPEWAPVRSRPQRNAYHRFTIDRHLLEAAANAAGHADEVARPDLLVLGALLHDIGKGRKGDHTDVGIRLVEEIGPRLGLAADDVAVLVQMVRHHLLLADVATRRDITDPAPTAAVAEAVGTPLVLELLAALTEADSLATGPSAWGNWKAELVAELVDRVRVELGVEPVNQDRWTPFPSPEVLALMGARERAFQSDGDRLTVVYQDRPGLLSRVAGILTLHGLDVVAARAHSDEQGMAASEFRVLERRDRDAWDLVIPDLRRALDGPFAIEARLAERARTYRRPRQSAAYAAVPTVRIDNAASPSATVVEVRAPDSIGVLYRITKALAELLLDIRHATVTTLGHEVVDSFYVREVTGAKVVDDRAMAELERAILHAVGE